MWKPLIIIVVTNLVLLSKSVDLKTLDLKLYLKYLLLNVISQLLLSIIGYIINSLLFMLFAEILIRSWG